jgi:hypothetical protein
MSGDDDLPIDEAEAQMWTLSADRETVRMELPETLLAALPGADTRPLRVHLKFDAENVDEMLLRLTELRARMLPPPQWQ